MSNNLETLGQIINPLDSIEDILANQDWVYDRLDENELSVHVDLPREQHRFPEV